MKREEFLEMGVSGSLSEKLRITWSLISLGDKPGSVKSEADEVPVSADSR